MPAVNPLDSIVQGYKDLGLSGFLGSGAITPASANGEYVRYLWNGGSWCTEYNGQPCFTHVDNESFIWWDSTALLWCVGPVLGGSEIDFTCPDPMTSVYTPVAGTGTFSLTPSPVWALTRSGDVPQTILKPYDAPMHPDLPRVTARYSVQITCYHWDPKVADSRAKAATMVFDGMKGSTTAATGWVLPGCHARSLVVSAPTLSAMEIVAQNRMLYLQVVNIHLINLTLN
jgi:hypothetical protein